MRASSSLIALPTTFEEQRDTLAAQLHPLDFLVEATRALLAGGAADAFLVAVEHAARAHARERIGRSDFRLETLLVEYRRAGRALRDAVARAGLLDDGIEDLLTDAIVRAAAASAEVAAAPRGGDPGLRELASQALLEDVLAQLPVGVAIIDARTGRRLFQNEEARRVPLDEYVHRPYTPDGDPTARGEPMRYRRDDGSQGTLLVSSRPLRDDGEGVALAVTSVQDVTALAAAETAVSELSQQLHLVANSVPIHLLLLDRDARILFANAAAAETWGRSPETLVGSTVHEVVGEIAHAQVHPFLQRALAGEIVAHESDFPQADGSIRTFLNTYTPYAGPDGAVRGFVATGTDITARKRAEDRLRASLDELHEERELRDRFVTALTHDLRTPLSAVRVGAELVIASLDEPARVERIVTRIVDSVDRADVMLRDLLDASLVRAGGRLPIDRVPCDLARLARQTLDELTSVHGGRFVLHGPETLAGRWDCRAIRRILENLCINAVKYGSRDHPITLTLAGDPQEVTVEVHNEGTPIAEADQLHLFDAFHRTDDARRGAQRGWGVGLALVKGLAEAHGGWVALASGARIGTTFRVVLPRA